MVNGVSNQKIWHPSVVVCASIQRRAESATEGVGAVGTGRGVFISDEIAFQLNAIDLVVPGAR